MGGFASVYRAEHRVDQQLYAIKKTILRVNSRNSLKTQDELQKMLKEVRYFAAIKDPHIIRYNHSWIEVTYKNSEEEKAETSDRENLEPDKDKDKNSVLLLSPYIKFEEEPPENGLSSHSENDILANSSKSNSLGTEKDKMSQHNPDSFSEK